MAITDGKTGEAAVKPRRKDPEWADPKMCKGDIKEFLFEQEQQTATKREIIEHLKNVYAVAKINSELIRNSQGNSQGQHALWTFDSETDSYTALHKPTKAQCLMKKLETLGCDVAKLKSELPQKGYVRYEDLSLTLPRAKR